MLALALLFASARALTFQEATQANPIRKVVTLLQDMQKEIEAEGEKEKDLFEKFQCYCSGNTDGMSAAAEEAAQRITELKAQLEAAKAEKSQIDQDLMQHGKDREAAKQDLAKAEAIRAKEHEEFTAQVGDAKDNVESMAAAIKALEKGMGKTFFVQMSKASLLRITKAAKAATVLDDVERDSVVSFLEGTQNPFGDYSAQSGEIVGMLKAMYDEMDKDLNGAVAAEDQAAAAFAELKAAKQQEIAAASEAIESKTKRQGDLAVLIATTGDDIEDTTSELNETQAFLANLASQCKAKQAEFDARTKLRSEEVAAISQAIKVLNDDDALDLFKKTLSLEQGPSTYGFLQKGKAKKSKASRAGMMIASLIETGSKNQQVQTQLGLVAYALKAKAVDFSKVLAMIDNMVTELKAEQGDDESQKAFCDKDLEKSAATKTELTGQLASSEATIEESKEASASAASEIASLQAEIKELDKAVADATEQRKAEHADFTQFSAENSAALQLLEKAKNKLFKFYRPNLHKEEETTPAPELLQEPLYVQRALKGVPAPPPETWGAYQKKDGKSNGVIALIENLAKELRDDGTQAKHDEDTSQSEYEKLMADSQASRASAVEGITAKEAAKADLDEKTENTKDLKRSQEAELANTESYIAQLHTNCDFLIQNFDLRKAARTNEIESLVNAKAVLSGASFE